MKKNGGDERIVVIIDIYMEMSQENFLGSYLYLKQKCHFFLLFSFSFFLPQNRKQEGQNRFWSYWGGVDTSGRGR
jgi:hypothetical protein